MALTIKVNNTESAIRVGDLISDSGATAKIYALKDTDDFVFKHYKDPKTAKNIEARLKHFIKNPPAIEGGGGEVEVLGVKFHSLAWPKHIVYKKGQCVGFIMPRISFDNSIQLNRIFSIKNREKEGITEDINWRILIAKNLAAMYAALHKEKYYVIDTKPANLRVYRAFQGISLLDCDGFKLQGSPYNGDMITKEYIAPESIGASPEKLGKNQDIFALSVLIFQIFNNGLHPYNGVPKTDEHLETQDRIGRGAYAYGSVESDYQSPSPASLHHLFPERLAKMFEDVFAKGKRPSAEKWVELLESFRDNRTQKSCGKIAHGKSFKKGCGACELSRILGGATTPPVAKPSSPSQQPTPSPAFVSKTPPKKGNGMFWVLMILGGAILTGFALDKIDSNKTPLSRTASSSNSTFSACSNTPSLCDSSSLCRNATVGTEWETRAAWQPHVREAKSRGLSCGVRQPSSGVASQNCHTNPSFCNSKDLCMKATVNKKWETRPEYLPYVRWAKRQNLSCGVSVASANSVKAIYLTSSGVWEQMLQNGNKMCGFTQYHNAGGFLKSVIAVRGSYGLTFTLYETVGSQNRFKESTILMTPSGKKGFD
ncbi:hypothetical protein N8977_04475, partial [Alphaproteobacteria bacterium]|nr:hypothetical protein [Alphaproteobacteria bacterium]